MSHAFRFRGSLTALITPMTADGCVDDDACLALAERQILFGSEGLVPCGTTGEAATLNHAERRRVIDLCVRAAAGRVPVVAGAGSNATSDAVALTRSAEEVGAAAVLHVTPYYNMPTGDGLVAHYEAVAAATTLPVLIYNVPARTGVDVDTETMERLARIPNVVGVKDAGGDLSRISRHADACGKDFIQLSGNDATAVEVVRLGGHGCISVLANVVPQRCADVQNACLSGDVVRAEALRRMTIPLCDALFSETNPTPVKYAMSRLGLCREDLRLPLLPATPEARRRIDRALDLLGLI